MFARRLAQRGEERGAVEERRQEGDEDGSGGSSRSGMPGVNRARARRARAGSGTGCGSPARPRSSPPRRGARVAGASPGGGASSAGGGPAADGFHDGPELTADRREPILHRRRPRRQHAPLEDARLLELAQPRRERGRWNPADRLAELVEADGAAVGGPQDRRPPSAARGGPPPGGPPRERGSQLRHAHVAVARRLERELEHLVEAHHRDGRSSPRARRPGRRRGRRGCARAGSRRSGRRRARRAPSASARRSGARGPGASPPRSCRPCAAPAGR